MTRLGWVRGEPISFIYGHRRDTGPLWLEEDRGYKTPCWMWLKSRNEKGYGHKWNGTSVQGAHRWMWEREKGPILNGLEVDHLCFNRACVNVEHLRLVTPLTNRRERRNVKLSEADAAEIRALREEGLTYREIAKRYPVGEGAIAFVIQRRSWR